jgi:DNA-binding YbaB/EbfC family protein
MAGNPKMLRQLQDMQERMARIQEDLGNKEVEGTSGGGVVRVRVNGHQKVLAIEISPETVDPNDVELLQDTILAAVNEALDRSRELAASEMGQLTAGMGLPPGLI